MKNEHNQEEILKKAIKEYGGEDPGKEFTFRVMDIVMAEARKSVKAWKPLLGWWFWGTLGVLLTAIAALVILVPGASAPEPAQKFSEQIAQNEVVGKVAEQAPVVMDAFNKQNLLWMGLIAVGALVLMDRILRRRQAA
jgi:hypothetical protein